MAEPVPAGSIVGHGTYQCTSCSYPLEIGSTSPLPPCPCATTGIGRDSAATDDRTPTTPTTAEPPGRANQAACGPATHGRDPIRVLARQRDDHRALRPPPHSGGAADGS